MPRVAGVGAWCGGGVQGSGGTWVSGERPRAPSVNQGAMGPTQRREHTPRALGHGHRQALHPLMRVAPFHPAQPCWKLPAPCFPVLRTLHGCLAVHCTCFSPQAGAWRLMQLPICLSGPPATADVTSSHGGGAFGPDYCGWCGSCAWASMHTLVTVVC